MQRIFAVFQFEVFCDSAVVEAENRKLFISSRITTLQSLQIEFVQQWRAALPGKEFAEASAGKIARRTIPQFYFHFIKAEAGG